MKLFQKFALPAALALTLAAQGTAYAGPIKNGDDDGTPSTPVKNGDDSDDNGGNGGGGDGDGDGGGHGGGHGFNGTGNGSGDTVGLGSVTLKCVVGKRVFYVRSRKQCYNYGGSILSRSDQAGSGQSGHGRYGNGHSSSRNRIKAGDIVVVSGGNSSTSTRSTRHAGSGVSCGDSYGQTRGTIRTRVSLVPTSRAAAMQLEKRMRKANSCGNNDLWLGAQVRRNRVSEVHVTRKSYTVRGQDGYVQSGYSQDGHSKAHYAHAENGSEKSSVRSKSKRRILKAKSTGRKNTYYYGHVKIGRKLVDRGYPTYCRPNIDKNGGF